MSVDADFFNIKLWISLIWVTVMYSQTNSSLKTLLK